MRIALRTTLTALALGGALALTVGGAPAGASTPRAATPAVTVDPAGCTAVTVVSSVRSGLKVELVNSAHSGATARLYAPTGGPAVSGVDQERPEDAKNGIRVLAPLGASPVFEQRAQAGAAWRATPFPALPADCRVNGPVVRTDRLGGQYTAQVYRTSAQAHTGRILFGKHLIGFVGAKGKPGAFVLDERVWVLNADGSSVTWTGAHTAARPAPGRYKLVDGSIVTLTRDAAGTYSARLASGGTTSAKLTVDERSGALRAGRVYVVLSADGTLAAHVTGTTKQAAPIRIGA
ncbi:hypothetical protein ACN20G_32795 (plasmid) [Streptomyces sp. BI20]|uniref:hypothetical protein n=1 Tax=Streptomyces sp. BI20 TaxID=3403460 RepID=UPI003C72A5B5